uniref:Chromosomal replication initiator protein n=1 Tax=Parastrongyloides trichosuri TaxID=131310 RepID=A0A0N5A119_PARTI
GGGALEAVDLVAGQLDDRALGGDVAIDDGVGAARHDRGVHAGDDLLTRGLLGLGGFGEQAAAADGRGVDDLARLGQPLGDQARAARREQVRGQEAAARLQVADDRSLDAGLVAVLDAEVDAGLGGDGRQVHDGVGRAARGRDGDGRVLQAGLGDVFAGGVAGEYALDDQATAALAFRALAGIDGGDVIGAHGADAHHRQGHGHGVGGELAAAGAGAGADRALDRLQALVGQGARAVGADGLEHLLDRDLLLADPARHDGAAVIDQAGDIHPGQSHGRRRDGLVAADNADD